MKMTSRLIAVLALGLTVPLTHAGAEFYGEFPVTVGGYSGNKTDSTSYSGQAARHVLHLSLKKLAASGNGQSNDELKNQMMAYYAGKDEGRKILSPTTKGSFAITQSSVDEISKGKDLKGKDSAA